MVSVVVPTYNCAPYLAEALDSALAQDYSPLEIIVADDGSTDDTAAVLARYAGRVTVLQTAHRGVSAARNAILAVACGVFIAPLDADDLWLPGKLCRQVQVMLERPNVALCHTGADSFGAETGDSPITADRRQKIDGDCFEAQFRQTGVEFSSVLLRRALIPAHGFYEDLPVAEDYALILQMLWGHEAVYLPELTTRRRWRHGQATADRGKRLQVYNGLARLRALDYLAGRIDPPRAQPLRSWALEEMKTCAYSRYWQRDYPIARRAFAWLRSYGVPIPWRHRLRATLGAWRCR
jgi:glycosyltransferase involved in cell wall biosynthesis